MRHSLNRYITHLLTILMLGWASESITAVEALQCPPCNRIHCYPKRASKLRCKGGITTGICGCCPTCAKIKSERCGGDFNYMGKCDRGLTCSTTGELPLFSSQQEPIGTCERMPRHQSDEGFAYHCRPLCTPEFCRRRPRAVCSARNVAEEKMTCQADCQHTACTACRFLRRPSCTRCSKDDFKCLKKFGKCIKKHSCKRKRFPCKWRSLKSTETGKFVCKIPGCLES